MRRTWGALRALDPVVAVAALVIALACGQLYQGATEVGITTDEPTHTDRMSTWLEHGWYVTANDLEGGRPKDDPISTPFVYGPAFSILAHGANVLAGNEAGGEIAATAAAYEVRHLIVTLLTLLASLAVGGAVWALTRSARFGLWAMAGLLAVPAWTGQGFFNLKDVPAGAGYTFVTVALVLALCAEPGAGGPRKRQVAIGALLAGGMFVGAGTRLSLWVPFLASLLLYAILRLGQSRLGRVARPKGTDVAVAVGTAVGAIAIAIAYPKAAATPVTMLVESVSSSAGYPGGAVTLTAGQLLPANPPLWYLPAWIAASYPLLLGALAVTGAAVGLRALVRAWRPAAQSEFWSRRELGLALVLQQAAMLPLAAIIGGAVMYDGIRQHLYVIPALAILAGLGAAWLWGRSRRGDASPTRRAVAAIVLGAALLIPMTEQTILFPYNYAYVNPVAGIGGVEGRWEGDYWQASAPEALSHVPRDAELLCAFNLIPPDSRTDVHIGFEPCYPANFEPLDGKRGSDVADGADRGAPALWVIGRHRAGNQAPDECEQVDNVTRWLRGERIVMSYVLRCPVDPDG